MRIRVSELEATAHICPRGYIEAIMSAAERQGEWLEIPTEDLRRIQDHYGTPEAPTGCTGCGN